MATPSNYRFLALLLVVYLAATAFFLVFIQHSSDRHLTSNHGARSPLLVRRTEIQDRPSPPLPLPELPEQSSNHGWQALRKKMDTQKRSVNALRQTHRTSDSQRSRQDVPTLKELNEPAGKAAEELRKAAGKEPRKVAAQMGQKISQAATQTSQKTSSSRRPLILFWTPLWGRFDSWSRFFSVPRLGECRARCSFTSKEERLPEAALVLFSAADLQRMPPPLEAGRPERFPGQMWALFAPDPPPADGQLQPRQIDELFNWTVSYRQDSDVTLQYGRTVRLAKPGRQPVIGAHRGRRALFRPQQCHTPSRREDYVRELSQHMNVDVLGPCGSTPCGPAPQCLANHAGNHTFYLALEAADCAEFASARLWQALRLGLIPVVRGGADYIHLAPPGSYIDAVAFSGPAALARHLRSLSDVQIQRLHRWRVTHQVLPADWACELCTRLHRLGDTGETVTAHSGDKLVKWWERGRCLGQSATPPAA